MRTEAWLYFLEQDVCYGPPLFTISESALAHNSQDCRMFEIARDHWRSSSPISLLNQGHLKSVAQNYVQMALEISKTGDSTTSLGNLCQCSVTLTVKMCFLMLRRSTFSLCPLPLVLSLGTTANRLASWSSHVPSRYLYTLMISREPSLLETN